MRTLSATAWLRSPIAGILRISPSEVRCDRRGFRPADREAADHLESIGLAFVRGYNLALGDHDPHRLGAVLDEAEPVLRGFAFEGAAMALTLLDTLLPGTSRFEPFLAGPGSRHAYMLHVGAGWALARLRRRPDRPMRRWDPLLGWLAVDGYGFHEGYFRWPRTVSRGLRPRRLTGYQLRAFDQGLGRSLWFVDGADVDRLPSTIARFPSSRQPDLWSGVGLAVAYAGGAEGHDIGSLRAAAGTAGPHLAQGAAFAAKARQRAGNPAPHTDLACRVLCRMTATDAAKITDDALEGIASDGEVPAYEVWRTRIRELVTARDVA